MNEKKALVNYLLFGTLSQRVGFPRPVALVLTGGGGSARGAQCGLAT